MRRRDMLRLAAVVPAAGLTGALATVLAGCDPTHPTQPTQPLIGSGDGPGEILAVRTDTGLTLVDADRGRVVAGPMAGVSGPGGESFAFARTGARTTVDVAADGGRQRFLTSVEGSWQPRVVSVDAQRVALAGPGSGGVYRPAGRTESTIVVAGAHGEQRRFTLPGCVEPEAFATTGELLFVLDYLPPQAPDRYRVRALDLATGELRALLLRDKDVIPPGAEEEMRGEGRQAVYAPGQRYLFTLYTHQPEHEHTRDLIGARDGDPHVHAFVHALHLAEGFAFCVDLPAPFGEGPPAGHAIALAPGGDDPVVVDLTSGTVAELDGVNLTVRRVGDIDPLPGDPAGASPAMAALGTVLVVARHHTVRIVRPDGFATLGEWLTPDPVRGLVLSGARLWVGQDGAAVAYDPATGEVVHRVGVPGLSTLESVHAWRESARIAATALSTSDSLVRMLGPRRRYDGV